jgi:hypothetical protein
MYVFQQMAELRGAFHTLFIIPKPYNLTLISLHLPTLFWNIFSSQVLAMFQNVIPPKRVKANEIN